MSLARRAFLRMSFAALATTYLNIPLPLRPEEDEWEQILDPVRQVVHYKHTTYGLGFEISEEMIEDDIYGTTEQLSQLVTRWGMNDLYPTEVPE